MSRAGEQNQSKSGTASPAPDASPPPRAAAWGGPFLILTAALLWSAGGLGIKWLKETAELPALAIAGWRSLCAVPILLVFCGRGLASVRPNAALAGNAVAYAATLMTLVAATTLTKAASAILLQYTAPVWLVVLNVLRPSGDRIGKRDLAVCAVCTVGLGLILSDQDGEAGMAGNLLGLASGLTYAILTRGLRAGAASGNESGSLPAVLAGNALVAACCLPWMTGPFPHTQAVHWAILTVLGTFQIGLPYILFAWAVRQVTPVRATLIAMAEPILNGLLVALFHHEVPGAVAIVGGAVLLGALAADVAIPRRADVVSPPAAPAGSSTTIPAAARRPNRA